MIIKKIPTDRELLERIIKQGLKSYEIAEFITISVSQLEMVIAGKLKLTPIEKQILLNLYYFMVLENCK